MTNWNVNDLGQRKNIEVLSELVSIADLNVVDAGCGSLTFTKLLEELGANVLAIDPDPIQAKANREAELPDRIRFVETGAEQIPAEDQSVDGIFFSYSLHHIDVAMHDAVFADCVRVLKPDGFIYVIEPLDCPWNQVMKLFHDEDRERAAAWETMQTWASRFRKVDAVEYYGFATYATWQVFADHLGKRSYNPDYTYEDVDCPPVKAAFEKHATVTEAGFEFQSPKRVLFMAEPK